MLEFEKNGKLNTHKVILGLETRIRIPINLYNPVLIQKSYELEK